MDKQLERSPSQESVEPTDFAELHKIYDDRAGLNPVERPLKLIEILKDASDSKSVRIIQEIGKVILNRSYKFSHKDFLKIELAIKSIQGNTAVSEDGLNQLLGTIHQETVQLFALDKPWFINDIRELLQDALNAAISNRPIEVHFDDIVKRIYDITKGDPNRMFEVVKLMLQVFDSTSSLPYHKPFLEFFTKKFMEMLSYINNIDNLKEIRQDLLKRYRETYTNNQAFATNIYIPLIDQLNRKIGER